MGTQSIDTSKEEEEHTTFSMNRLLNVIEGMWKITEASIRWTQEVVIMSVHSHTTRTIRQMSVPQNLMINTTAAMSSSQKGTN